MNDNKNEKHMAKQHVKVLPRSQEYLDLVSEYCGNYDFYDDFLVVHFENKSAKRSFSQLLLQYHFCKSLHSWKAYSIVCIAR